MHNECLEPGLVLGMMPVCKVPGVEVLLAASRNWIGNLGNVKDLKIVNKC